MSLKVYYNGKKISELSGLNTIKLKTAGKYYKGDIRFDLNSDITTRLWNQCPKAVSDFMNNVNYNENDYSNSYIENYAPEVTRISNTKPIGTYIEGKYYYNLEPKVFTDYVFYSIAYHVMPLDSLRLISAKGNNIRDLGGYNVSGGTVKYGLLIRGGEISSPDRSVLVDELGMRHEVNLRGNETENTESPLGDDIHFFRPAQFSAYSVQNNPYLTDTVSYIITAINHNEPVFFHCNLGADRTGTLAFILEEILGFNQSDIDKDYELSMFYTNEIKRTRCNKNAYKKLVDEVMTFTGDTMMTKVINYMLKKGETIDRINRFREKMIKGTPVKLYTVQENFTNCTATGGLVAITDSYKSTLCAKEGYTLTGADVRVTMGNVDITDNVYSDGEITINNPTDNITITVSAVPISVVLENEIVKSTDENGNIYNSVGYKDGYRINNYANEEEATGAVCTGFIPVKQRDRVSFYNEYIGNGGGYECSFFYDENKNIIKDYKITPYFLKQNAEGEGMAIYSPYNYDTTVKRLYSFTVPADSRIAYVRFTLHSNDGGNAVIVVE